jgi:hypothetical protein
VAVPTGIAPSRWWIVFGEGALWCSYGVLRDSRALVLFGVVAAATSAAILGRLWTARRQCALTLSNAGG